MAKTRPLAASQNSGQILLVSLFILLSLVVALGTVVWVNHVSTHNNVAITAGNQADPMAQKGIQYAVYNLQWQWELYGWQFTGYDGTRHYPGSDDGYFTILVSSGPPAQSYQVGLLATAYSSQSGINRPRSVQAFISQRTLGVSLPRGLNPSLALELMHVPQAHANNALTVHWGPIGVWESLNLWTLYDPLDNSNGMIGFPRKFSQAGITGHGSVPGSPNYRVLASTEVGKHTDQKEYWAFTALGTAPTINEVLYISSAVTTLGLQTPTCTIQSDCNPSPAGSGYFKDVQGDTAVFTTGVGGPYSVPPTGTVYVDGNARFDSVSIDAVQGGNWSGAFVITGNLILGTNQGGQILNDVRVPNTALLEYPYDSAHTQCPCYNVAKAGGGICRSSDFLPPPGKVQYRGALYVKGDLIVTDNKWVLDGAVRVDGNVIINPGADLTILYDDRINHEIAVNTTELQIDQMTEVTAR